MQLPQTRFSFEMNPATVNTGGAPARSQRRPGARQIALSALALACSAMVAGVQAQQAQRLAEPAALSADENLSAAPVRVIVQFDEPAVSRMRPNFSFRTAARADVVAHRDRLVSAKRSRLAAIAALGGHLHNTLEFAINGAVITIPGNRLAQVRQLAGVKSARIAGTYQLFQSTPPSVGQLMGTVAANTAGVTGSGVAIAIIDTGVDYTHASFGGPGSTAYYAAATAGSNAQVITDTPGVFPNGPQVKGGYDWLGDVWNGSSNLNVVPDPDPIDNKQTATDFAGHGTFGASAAAGQPVASSLLPAGSAPGAVLLAYRGCSRISSSCEGSALLNSIDSVMQYAAGFPNGGQAGANNPALPAATRFVINMSLGADGGNPQPDDLSEASRNAVRAGITVVAAAGNAGNIPFITGTPAAADLVLSVAASQPATLTGPSLGIPTLNLSYPLITASFGVPLVTALTAPLAIAGPNRTLASNVNLACSGSLSGSANPGPASPAIPALSGAIGIADRGTCGFNEKALNTQRAGAAVSLIANNAANAGPLGMASGPAAGITTIPSYSIGTAESAAVKAALINNPGLQATVSPLAVAANVAAGVNLVDLIADFSSRGPGQNSYSLKPEITAPGVNIYMASIGSGTAGASASGTSFATPLTSGAAALVLSANPGFTPWQVKAALMNTANTTVYATKTASTSTLAPITRMGAGRVQAERAAATTTLAYDSQDIDSGNGTYYNAGVSFGPQAFAAPGVTTVARSITVQNLGASAKTYSVAVAPRFADDAAKGVTFAPSVSTLTVPGNSTASFDLVATGTGSAIPAGGLNFADGCSNTAACVAKFNDIERDGLVTINGGTPTDLVTVPYLMYARKASQVAVQRLGASVIASNSGAASTTVDVFNLIGTRDPQDLGAPVFGSEILPVDIKAVGLRYTANAFAAPAGLASGDLAEVAIALWSPLDTLRQAVLNVDIDTNNDGVADFTVQNLQTTNNTSAVFVTPAGGSPGNAYFLTTGGFNTTKMVLPFFASAANFSAGSRIGIRVRSSNYRGGPDLDFAPDGGGFIYVQPNRLVNTPAVRSFTLAAGAAARVGLTTTAANATLSPADKGLLIFSYDNPTATEAAVLQLVN